MTTVKRYFLLYLVLLGSLGCSPAKDESGLFTSLEEIEIPARPGSREPALFSLDGGRILMSWMEPTAGGFAVKTAFGNSEVWSDPKTAAISEKLFVNWADTPSVAAFGDGMIAAHWLMESGSSSYDYNINLALSADMGNSWGAVIVPHTDRSQTQHGFVTLLPIRGDRLLAVWLDGREYGKEGLDEADFSNAMQLRATTLNSEGAISDDILLDARVCSCCQTSAAVTGNGSVIVVYRDRTRDEIRDISAIRFVNGNWTKPETIHNDGWEIAGCPVNGPNVDAHGKAVVVGWYSAAGDQPMVHVAFSSDYGANFNSFSRVDLGNAAGRVNVVQLEDGSALVSWIELEDAGETLLVCRARPNVGCISKQAIIQNKNGSSLNFPKMVRSGEDVYFAWTQHMGGGEGNALDSTKVKLVHGRF